MRKIASLIIVFLIGAISYSQVNNGKITGKVLLENSKPALKATLSLLREKDSATIKLGVPDDNGIFEFENLKNGKYLVSISYAGYKKHVTSTIEVSEAVKTINIPDILLEPGANQLSDIKIEAKKPFIERKADRLIVYVENSIVSTGSTALDVLQRSPGVFVNEESGISLKGKSGLIIMIDGKVTPLSGTDLITYLKSIPSANIERIDIITNPSAKYDAAGNAGIIDIRFKKDKRDGYNGSLGGNFGQGMYNKTSANGSINFRRKKWNVFSNAAYNSPDGFGNFFINRKFFTGGNGPVEAIFNQNTFTKQPQQSTNMKAGVDYYLSKNTVMGVMLNGTAYKGTRDGLSNALVTDPNGAPEFTNITANNLKDKRYNIFGNFNYKHTFDSTGRELNADIDMGKFNARPFQDILAQTFDNNHNLTGYSVQTSDQQSTITVKSFKADYTHPLKNKAKFEVGVKTSFVTTDNDVKFFNVINGASVLDLTRSNHFVYTENVNAAYLNYSKDFAKTGIQFGLRLEHTHSNGDQITTGQNLDRDYVQLFPSFFINQKLSENNEVSFSYSRRIDRPSYRQLNPFKILVDNYTYVLGDPYLKPVLTNSLQLGYTFKSKYNATLSYIQSFDAITDVFVQDDATKISSQIPANFQTFHQYDLSVNVPVSVKKWLNSNCYASLTYSKYNSPLQGGNLNNESLSWGLNVVNSIIIGKKGWSAELSGFYQSKTAWGQFIIKSLAQISTGIQKLSKNKKSVYKLALADIFSTNHIAVLVQYQNQDWHTNRTWDSRFVTLSYTYRFGKNTVARTRQRTSGVEDEKKRAN